MLMLMAITVRKPELVVTSSPTLVVIKDKFPKVLNCVLMTHTTALE